MSQRWGLRRKFILKISGHGLILKYKESVPA
jgi:hypothetical protein